MHKAQPNRTAVTEPEIPGTTDIYKEKLEMDAHCESLLQEFRDVQDSLEIIKDTVNQLLADAVAQTGIYVTAMESRVKTESSLIGKLELKGQKYRSLFDITDLVGARVITFYNDEADKVAALVEKLLDVDWENSIDKRRANDFDRFGYMSIHYVCSLPKSLYYDPSRPELNEIRFEIQIRTALQHVWATVCHDLGYKSDIDIPKEYMRRLSCMAGLLEMADREFLSFRTEIESYRRKVLDLIRDKKFDDITLDTESFEKYLELRPFDRLNEKIASINHAEVQQVSLKPYLNVLLSMGFKTLGDLERMKTEYCDAAYDLARHQFGNTDLDILASSIGLSSLCMVYILKEGGGEQGLIKYYETLYGPQPHNESSAKRVSDLAKKLNIV